MSVTAAADGILRIAVTAMSYAVKAVTTERGFDAGDFALIAYGGAGPLHAVEVAREIGITKVIIPVAPGVFSAFGMLFSDLRYDYVRTWPMRLEEAGFDLVERIHRELEEEGRRAIAATSVTPRKVTVKRALTYALCQPERRHGRPADGRVFPAGHAAIKRHFDVHAAHGTSAPRSPPRSSACARPSPASWREPLGKRSRGGPRRRRRVNQQAAVYFRGRGFVPRGPSPAPGSSGNRIRGRRWSRSGVTSADVGGADGRSATGNLLSQWEGR
jgi:N-methylhydantoinase A